MHLPIIISAVLASFAAANTLPSPRHLSKPLKAVDSQTHPSPQHIFSNPSDPAAFKIPTVHESAVMARRILRLESFGTLSTVFPTSQDAAASESRPDDVQGAPIGLMEYFADCEPESGDPTILAISIATSFRNEAAGSNITLSLRWHPENLKHYSAASLPRFSLIGYLEPISNGPLDEIKLRTCFAKYHPDAVVWMPGNRIHASHWVRLIVKEVYWLGGFGDRAYIGWIPAEEWKSVTAEEIEECRLPGEKEKEKDSSSVNWLEKVFEL